MRSHGRFLDEAVGVCGESGVGGDLSGGVDGVGLAIANLVWRHQPEADMVMGLVIPGEEFPARRAWP